MHRIRLREAYTDEQLKSVYAVPHRHDRWEDHIHRVEQTISFAKRNGMYGRVADLSCGDAAIAKALSPDPVLGDFAEGYAFQGPIEDTISLVPYTNVFVLCETLEHLDDPDTVLWKIRERSDQLLLSTPIHRVGEYDGNEEHYWMWDEEAVCEMLRKSAWMINGYAEIYNGMGYRFQTWAAF